MSGREARFEDRFGGSSSSLTPGAGDGATQGAKDGQPGSPSDSPPPNVAGSNPAPARPTQGYRTGKAVGPDPPQSGASSAAQTCDQRDVTSKYVCGKPKDHDGAHVAVLYGGRTVVGWGGTK